MRIKNNDKDIKSNYDTSISNKNSLRDVNRKIYATNTNIANINSDIESINSDIENIEESNIKHNYTIDDIWFLI